MNNSESEILIALKQKPFCHQRELAQRCSLSVGSVNKTLHILNEKGLLDIHHHLTPQAEDLLTALRPQRAVILAAGFGLRMVPIHRETPKALLKVRGEALIERQIRQLREAGVKDITVVVGFMKEHFEYLIDDFGVSLTVNPDYASANNLFSLLRAADRLENAYIVPCDLYAEENPFRPWELHSWYMVTDRPDPDSPVRVSRAGELVETRGGIPGNAMVGIAYVAAPDTPELRHRLKTLAADPAHRDSFWEDALAQDRRLLFPARKVPAALITEINTYEQLRELDGASEHLRNETIALIARELSASPKDITQITLQKKGMTNRSFLFSCHGKRYIMRIPGEGTDQLIDRRKEAAVYRVIRDRGICDPVIYLNPENGYKITEYMEGARVCDPETPKEVRHCMARLRDFHALELRVEHTFDIFGQIEFYESLWKGAPSVFRDYAATKDLVLSLRPWLESRPRRWALTHIDAVPDNFLFCPGSNGAEQILLIDWEYAGMQDQDVDLAMFCIYALYDRAHTDALINAYYPEGCPEEKRYKIYGYVAACGLLWSNWCEFKRQQGVEFGEYALRQYRYAKDYGRLLRDYIAVHPQ